MPLKREDDRSRKIKEEKGRKRMEKIKAVEARAAEVLQDDNSAFSTLTEKEKEYVKAKAAGDTGTDAALKSFDVLGPQSANAISGKLLKKPRVQMALREVFVENGITQEELARVAREGLNATIIERDNETGALAPTVLPDHNTRHKYLKTALDVLERNNPEANLKTNVNVNVNVDMNPDELAGNFEDFLKSKFKKKSQSAQDVKANYIESEAEVLT